MLQDRFLPAFALGAALALTAGLIKIKFLGDRDEPPLPYPLPENAAHDTPRPPLPDRR